MSVVLAVHNGERFLRAAIESVLDQTFTDFELIVLDDGSSDSSPAIIRACAEADQRVRMVVNPENLGLTKSLNRGLALARGEFVARMDADDISLPERFERQVAFLTENPSVALVGSWARVIDDAGAVTSAMTVPTASAELRAGLVRGNCLIHSSVMFRKSVIEAIGGYDEAFRHAQDYDLWLRLSERFDVANLPEYLLEYRIHGGHVSARKIRSQRRTVDRALALAGDRRRAAGETPENIPPAAGRWDRLRGAPGTLGHDYLMWAGQHIRSGDRWAATRLVFWGLFESPFNARCWATVPRAMGVRRAWRQMRQAMRKRWNGATP